MKRIFPKIALSPQAPPGSTPNALALSHDGATLLVANADNNTVAVVDPADRPGDPHVAVRVPPVELVTIVEVDGDPKSLFG